MKIIPGGVSEPTGGRKYPKWVGGENPSVVGKKSSLSGEKSPLVGEKSRAESEPLSPRLVGDMSKGGGEKRREEGGVADPSSRGGGDEEYMSVTDFKLAPKTFNLKHVKHL
jgi:hypothetical protein